MRAKIFMTLAGLLVATSLMAQPALADDEETLPPLLQEDFLWCAVYAEPYHYVCIGSGSGGCRWNVYPWYPGNAYGIACEPELPV